MVGPPPGFSELTEVCIKILNTPPVCGNIEYSVLEGEVLTVSSLNGVINSTCFDPDPQDVLTVILDTLPLSQTGSFVCEDNGSFVYDHDCSDLSLIHI